MSDGIVGNQISGVLPIQNSLFPPQRPRGKTYRFDWTSTSVYAQDLTRVEEGGALEYVQTVWIDNASNPLPFTLAESRLGQRITVAPYRQGFYPIILPTPAQFRASSGVTAGRSTTIILINTPIPPCEWESWDSGLPSTGFVNIDGIAMAAAGASTTLLAVPAGKNVVISRCTVTGLFSGVASSGGLRFDLLDGATLISSVSNNASVAGVFASSNFPGLTPYVGADTRARNVVLTQQPLAAVTGSYYVQMNYRFTTATF